MTVSALLAAALVVALALSGVFLWSALRALRAARDRETALLAQRQLDLFCAARRDPLTGLQSRAVFLDNLAIRLARGSRCALLIIDLDGFGRINGVHGDGAGNEVLRTIALRLCGTAGQSEAVARLHADKFALLLDTPETVDSIEETALRLTRRLAEPYPASGNLVEASASIGIACAPCHGSTADTLMRAAHTALRRARAQGGATWMVCGDDAAARLLQRDRFRDELSSAIDSGQIIPYYQPIIRLSDGGIDKLEVLARWDHPLYGLLTAEDFIPLSEELGLAGQISMSLLRQVALDSQCWPANCRFAINVAAGQVRELINFVVSQPGDWQRRMDISRLDIEITENALLRDRDMARSLIDALHEHGGRAVLDNFGNGYSNLFHLHDLHFDHIKICQSFIKALRDDVRARACVAAMLKLGFDLGIDMIAGGIELAETEAQLVSMGCALGQGFFYAHPTPADAVPEMVKRLGGQIRAAA